MHKEGTDLRIFDPVSLHDMGELFEQYALSLSISEARNTGVLKKPVRILHLRNFEIPMGRGLQFCQYFDDVAECFEEDKEIIFYRTAEEAVDKARFYMQEAQASTRMHIKLAARLRAEAEHTWYCRFKKAFEYLYR